MTPLDLACLLDALEHLDQTLGQLTGPLSKVLALDEVPEVAARAGTLARDLRARLMERVRWDRSLEANELALRAWASLALSQVAQMQTCVQELPPQFWTARGPFRCIEHVRDYVYAAIDRVFRCRTAAPWGLHTRRVESMAAVVAVEQLIREAGRDAGFSCLLAAGAAVSSPGFSMACRVLAAQFDIELAPFDLSYPATTAWLKVQRIAAPHSQPAERSGVECACQTSAPRSTVG